MGWREVEVWWGRRYCRYVSMEPEMAIEMEIETETETEIEMLSEEVQVACGMGQQCFNFQQPMKTSR